MERMMELSSNFMESIDLENAQFEDKGLQMLEEFEKQSTLLMLEAPRTKSEEFSLDDLSIPDKTAKNSKSSSSYDSLFD